eukprot:11833189-Prorocentrum_lima.AAC.1
MTSSLVGSEMCIRDSKKAISPRSEKHRQKHMEQLRGQAFFLQHVDLAKGCLLYTSDAADDM